MKGKFLFSIILLITTITNYYQAQKLSKPESNFEFFWQTFDKNYSGFKVRKVDWRQQYIKYRPLVTQNTPDDESLKKDLIDEMRTYFNRQLRLIDNSQATTVNQGRVTASQNDAVDAVFVGFHGC
jgi:hypothetical protein